MTRVAVVIPCFAQAHFLPRALASLAAQRLTDWEAVIVDDGSPDDVASAARPWRGDPRVRLHREPRNMGLGRAVNIGIDATTAPIVAVLPSDDIWYADHLALLVAALDAAQEARHAVSGIRYRVNHDSPGRIPGHPLQLAQVAWRRGPERWVERDTLTTDDLDRMFWSRLGEPVTTGTVTCQWTDHPLQRHKTIQEPKGGINPYRVRHTVATPLIFHATTGHRIDEVNRYRAMRERVLRPDPDGLKILIVGELAYNPERILALAEAGHQLFGLWLDTPYWYNWVGPLPFGHVTDLPRNDWQAAVRRIKPDVIYALLNWQTIRFAHHVMTENPGVPFVWHFKEGPFIAMEHGCWPELVELTTRADGVIHSSHEMRDWFATAVPQTASGRPEMVLDGDLPKRDWLSGQRSPRLSERDGAIHTVVPGRPIGLHPEDVADLAAHDIHLHFYGEFTHGQWRGWIERTKSLAGNHIHLHPNVDQENWVSEFSQYDAGWLHRFQSRNGGDIARADWDDLNIPARAATLAAAGLPMIQHDNSGHIVAMQATAATVGAALVYREVGDLAERLVGPERDRMAESCWQNRAQFQFDTHVPALIAFLRSVAAR